VDQHPGDGLRHTILISGDTSPTSETIKACNVNDVLIQNCKQSLHAQDSALSGVNISASNMYGVSAIWQLWKGMDTADTTAFSAECQRLKLIVASSPSLQP
jgi:hypothetical protein